MGLRYGNPSYTNTELREIDALLQYSGTVSVDYPPSTPTFDPENRRSSLHTRHHRPQSALGSTSSNIAGVSGDLAHLSQIISNVVSMARTPLKPPTTPTRRRTSSAASSVHSPTWNTPSKLSRFLKYAETNLGVENACLHEEGLQMLGFGPDILHLVEDGVLKDVGFTPGDVICLKQNSQQWWNSTDAKHKRASHMPSPVQSTPPSKRVTFEKRYHNGGGYKLYGPKMIEGDLPLDMDFDWYYFCKATDAMMPVPLGYVPVLDGENDDSEDI